MSIDTLPIKISLAFDSYDDICRYSENPISGPLPHHSILHPIIISDTMREIFRTVPKDDLFTMEICIDTITKLCQKALQYLREARTAHADYDRYNTDLKLHYFRGTKLLLDQAYYVADNLLRVSVGSLIDEKYPHREPWQIDTLSTIAYEVDQGADLNINQHPLLALLLAELADNNHTLDQGIYSASQAVISRNCGRRAS